MFNLICLHQINIKYVIGGADCDSCGTNTGATASSSGVAREPLPDSGLKIHTSMSEPKPVDLCVWRRTCRNSWVLFPELHSGMKCVCLLSSESGFPLIIDIVLDNDISNFIAPSYSFGIIDAELASEFGQHIRRRFR